MAVPAPFPGANFTFKAPEGRADVLDLHVFTNGHANVSAWQLGPDELADVIRTGIVFLSVLSGQVFYPVCVGSEDSIRAMVADYGKVWERPRRAMESPAEVHNRVAPELLKQVVAQARTPSDALIMAESLLLGIALHYGAAQEHIDLVIDRVRERLSEQRSEARG